MNPADLPSHGPLVDPLPSPAFLSVRSAVARQLILVNDQIRLRARPAVRKLLGGAEGYQLNGLVEEYERLSA